MSDDLQCGLCQHRTEALRMDRGMLVCCDGRMCLKRHLDNQDRLDDQHYEQWKNGNVTTSARSVTR